MTQRKKRYTVTLDEPVLEEVRKIAYWTPGLSISASVQQALEAWIKVMEANRGESFPSIPQRD